MVNNSTGTKKSIGVIAVLGLLVGIALALAAVPQDVGAQQAGQGCWDTKLDNLGDQGQAFIRDMDASPDGEIWAIGTWTPFGKGPEALALRWNGTQWVRVSLPQPGVGTELAGIVAVSKNDVWAVGSQYNSTISTVLSLIMHWDGTRWRVVPSPNPSSRNNFLKAIDAVSIDDVWAVGYYNESDGSGEQTFTLHWDGSEWRQVPSPGAQVEGSTRTGGLLYDVAVQDASNVWAVGNGADSRLLAMRWDGQVWRTVPVTATPQQGVLYGVTALRSGEAWVAGIAGTQPVALKWNGVRWEQMEVPPLQKGGAFKSIVALSPTEVWAVGSYAAARFVPPEELVMKWSGSTGSIIPGPVVQAQGQNPPIGSSLETATLAGGDLWIGGWGSLEARQYGLLSKRVSGSCASLTPTRAVPLNPPVPVPGSGSRTFPETGKTMTGIFLNYWQRNGGLAQQGYPISPVIGEVSELNGRMYTMQYTERAVFEYHPENQPPFNVLLSQLGTFQYRNKYPGGAPSQKPNNEPGSVLFRETGKRLGGRFLEYWRANGGLMQQGYPISEEFTEVSPLNGKAYTVQYFERAVFEYHPENARPYDVLLSHMGLFRWNGKYSAGGTPVPPVTTTVTPVATPGSGNQPIATNVMGRAVANNRYLFWIKDDSPSYSIYGYDWEQKSTFLVTSRPGPKFSLATDDRTVVWGEGDFNTEATIRGYDIINRTELVAVPSRAPGSIMKDTLVIDGAMLYYVGTAGGPFGIIARNIVTGQENMVIEGGRNPVIWGDTMVWSKEVARCSEGNRPPCTFDQELYVRKANNDRFVTRVTGQVPFSEYAVWGDHVAWIGPNPLPEVNPLNVYRISTSSTNRLTEMNSSRPAINDTLVAWAYQDNGGNAWSLNLHDLSTGQTRDIVPRTGAYTEAQAFIGQRAIAYTVGGMRDPLLAKGDLYVVDLAVRP